MLVTLTAYTGPEALDRRFSIANCYFEDADMSKYCSYIVPTSSKIDLTFCSYWLLLKLLYKTEYNLCGTF